MGDAHTGELHMMMMMMTSSIMAADEEGKFGRPASAVGARESRSRPVCPLRSAIAILCCCSHGSDNEGNSRWTMVTPLGTQWARKVCGVLFGSFFMFSTFYPLDLRNDTCVALANL